MAFRVLTPFLLLAVLMTSPAIADGASPSEDTCYSDEQRTDGVVGKVERAPTCRRAFEIMTTCATAGSGDGPVGNAVIEKCEAQFLPRMTTSQRRAYSRRSTHCIDRYANQQGSLYGSKTAFCRARLAMENAIRYARRR